MDFKQTVKQIRKSCFLSQKEFAEEVGVSFCTVNRWETGKALPNYQTLKKLDSFCKQRGIQFEMPDDLWED